MHAAVSLGAAGVAEGLGGTSSSRGVVRSPRWGPKWLGEALLPPLGSLTGHSRELEAQTFGEAKASLGGNRDCVEGFGSP